MVIFCQGIERKKKQKIKTEIIINKMMNIPPPSLLSLCQFQDKMRKNIFT